MTRRAALSDVERAETVGLSVRQLEERVPVVEARAPLVGDPSDGKSGSVSDYRAASAASIASIAVGRGAIAGAERRGNGQRECTDPKDARAK